MVSAYCTDCEWTATVDDQSRQELNRAMIDHFVETGHTLVAESTSDCDCNCDEGTADSEPTLQPD